MVEGGTLRASRGWGWEGKRSGGQWAFIARRSFVHQPFSPPRYQRGASGHLFLHLRSTTAFPASVHARLEHKRGVQRGGVGGKETNILRAQGWGRGGGARPPSPPPSLLTFLLIQRACAVCTSLIAVVLSRPVLQQSTTRLPRRLHTLDSQRDEAQQRRGPRRN